MRAICLRGHLVSTPSDNVDGCYFTVFHCYYCYFSYHFSIVIIIDSTVQYVAGKIKLDEQTTNSSILLVLMFFSTELRMSCCYAS